MLFRRLIGALALFAASTANAAPDNAGIFFYGAPPDASAISRSLPDAKVTTETNGKKLIITIRDATFDLRVTKDPEWPREVQLSGIRGFLDQFPEDDRRLPSVVEFLANLDRTTSCYGSVLPQGYDASGNAAAALLRILAAGGGGFIFSQQGFYNTQGEIIVGLPGAPKSLGAEK